MPKAALPRFYGPAALGEVLLLQDRNAVMCRWPEQGTGWDGTGVIVCAPGARRLRGFAGRCT